jgi:hypothetical protein
MSVTLLDPFRTLQDRKVSDDLILNFSITDEEIDSEEEKDLKSFTAS